jgi:diguanylate cyclase (GGDEF)-like protein
MRLATITNWAYGVTVVLTLASGTTMLLASAAQEHERTAVAQRHKLDQATSAVGVQIYALTGQAREYVISGDPGQLIAYRRGAAGLGSVEARIRDAKDAGALADELNDLKEAIRSADSLRDEQLAAIVAWQSGDHDQARKIMFGAEYARELDRAQGMVERFQDHLNQRTDAEVAAATELARFWRTTSEIVLAITAFLSLCVLYFIFKQRVLRPVIRLSDVVTRLAAKDYAAELPDVRQFDEIGDMAQAIRVFRENGLQRQQLEEERTADRATRDLLSRMTQRMQGCDTMHDLKEIIQRFVPEITPSLAGRLYIFDEARNAVVEACNWLSPVQSRSAFPPLACWGLRRGVPHRPSGESIDVFCDHLDLDKHLTDSICLPLTSQRETLGLLYFEPRIGAAAEHSKTAEVYLKVLAENIALALANLRLRGTLREMAMADTLTGLANRRQLDAVLEILLAEANRQGTPISCVMLDVDHFKRFNDTFGHAAGDAVLREVGAALKHCMRESGLAFRYGGEEFLLLMPGFGPEQATARAEEIRARIAALHVTQDGRELGPITASLGVATAPEHCAFDRLVQVADAALLRAKQAGRDRVVVVEARRKNQAAA